MVLQLRHDECSAGADFYSSMALEEFCMRGRPTGISGRIFLLMAMLSSKGMTSGHGVQHASVDFTRTISDYSGQSHRRIRRKYFRNRLSGPNEGGLNHCPSHPIKTRGYKPENCSW
jgi:hypothetical protein